MNTEQMDAILKASSLAVGSYTPSNQLLKSNSIVITYNHSPMLAVGKEGDQQAMDLATRLIHTPDFQAICQVEYGFPAQLNIAIMPNARLLNSYECYYSLIKSEQGAIEATGLHSQLEAITLSKNSTFAQRLCISSAVMQCFHPESKPLPSVSPLGDLDHYAPIIPAVAGGL